MKFYENGTLVNTMANSIGLATKQQFKIISRLLYKSNATNLKMYNFMVYDRAFNSD